VAAMETPVPFYRELGSLLEVFCAKKNFSRCLGIGIVAPVDFEQKRLRRLRKS
jgi:hypothetical protein